MNHIVSGVVKIPASEVALYSFETKHSRKLTYNQAGRKRREAKGKLEKAIALDDMVRIGSLKRTTQYSEKYIFIAYWMQAAPKKYFSEKSGSYNSFTLVAGGKEFFSACQCYYAIKKRPSKIVNPPEVVCQRKMTEVEAIEEGWRLTEDDLWQCPKCSEVVCKHEYSQWYVGDKLIYQFVNGSMIDNGVTDRHGVVLKPFEKCNLCGTTIVKDDEL